jgi:signal transduction histidine kinase
MRLVVESGPDTGSSFACPPGIYTIGKLESCDIRLKDPHVSRRHGVLEVTPQGVLYRDLGSTNGSAVHRGNQQIWLETSRLEERLLEGDLIVLGQTRLRVEAAAEGKILSPTQTTICARSVDGLQETLRRSLDDRERLRTIYQLERRIYLECEPERMLEAIVNAVPEALPQATHVVIALLDKQGKDIARTLGKAGGDPAPAENRVPLSTSIARRVLEERKSLLWKDVPQEFAESNSIIAMHINSSMCAPLWTGEKIVGFLQVDNRSGGGTFSEADLDLLTIFANTAALAIVNRELYDQAQAYVRLQETERVKSKYMRKVSHELRSPLGAIQSTLGVVLRGLTGELPAKAKEMVARAEARAEGLLKVTNDLLTLSRARDARFSQQLQPVNLNETLSKVAGLLASRALEAGIELKVEAEENLPPLKADPEAMEGLFTNLIANGIKYNRRGGKLKVRMERTHEAVKITVSDTGIGIPAEDLPKLFTEFFRSENARQFTTEGTGLGMSIVKAIVDNHRGTVSVHSEVNVGTTFEITLPFSGTEDTAS